MFKKIALVLFMGTLSTMAFAAGGGGGSLFSLEMAAKCVNFGILLWVLHRFARPPIVNMLRDAATRNKEDVEEAKDNVKKAEAKLADYKNKLANMEKELEEGKQAALHAIEEEKNAIITEAKEAANNMEQQASHRIDQELKKAQQEIRNFLADESIRLAEEMVSQTINAKTNKPLIKNYSTMLEKTA